MNTRLEQSSYEDSPAREHQAGDTTCNWPLRWPEPEQGKSTEERESQCLLLLVL